MAVHKTLSTQRRKDAEGRKEGFVFQIADKAQPRIKARQFISVRPEPVEGMNGGSWLSLWVFMGYRPSAVPPFDLAQGERWRVCQQSGRLCLSLHFLCALASLR
jgi:hypothetical protein